jgi:MFS superfamily sulfate permease-like transporter
MVVTFIACLGIGLDYGILTGIGVNLMFILYNSARPRVQVRNLTVSLMVVKYRYGCVSVRFSGTIDYSDWGMACRRSQITSEYLSNHHHVVCLMTGP